MTVKRFAISFDADLADRVRHAAGDTPISTWLADAAEAKLRAEGLMRVVEDWEREHGRITEEELAAVDRAWRGQKRRRRHR
jgi:hypothetical protein